jgi:predicted HicB family RNase H-like nuclease
MATAYTIRDFPEDLHRRAKATAALEGISLRELILKSLQAYVERDKQRKEG